MINLEQASQLFEAGFNVIPLTENKTPALKENPYFSEYVTDDLVQRWFTTGKPKIGVACGITSGNLFAIDFDGHGNQPIQNIFEAWRTLPHIQAAIQQHAIAIYQTPRGGFHVIYRTELPMPNQVFARWADNEVMIESRGQGGYIVCAPSEGYKRIAGCELTKVDEVPQEVHIAMIGAAITFSHIITENQKESVKGAWPERWDNETPEGRFNNECADEARGVLFKYGWQLAPNNEWDKSMVEKWVRPGKSYRDGISATWGWKHNMFYLFSSSVPQLGEAGKAYTPFNILVAYEYSGDWRKAKDDLRARFKMDKFYKKDTPPIEPRKIEDEPEPDRIPFPLHALPVDMQNFAIECNRTLNFSIDFMAVSMLSAVTGVAGNHFKLHVKNGWDAPLIFWFAIVGAPGTLKTHPLSTALKPVRGIDNIHKRAYDIAMDAYIEENKNNKKEDTRNKPKYRQILLADTTIEAMHMVHDFNKRGVLMYRDELVGLMQDMNKYRKGSDEQFWLESFNNSSYTINRVSREPICLNNICINLIGTIQPSVLYETISQSSNNGFIDRFLFTEAETKVFPMNAENINPEWFTWWDGVISGIDDFCGYPSDPQVWSMDDEAFAEFLAVDKHFCEMQNGNELNETMKGYLSKMKTYLPRFAMLIGVLDAFIAGVNNDSYITGDQMKRARLLIDYFIATAKKVFEDSNSATEVKNVAQKMGGQTTKEQIISLHEKGIKVSKIAERLKVSRAYIYKMLKPE